MFTTLLRPRAVLVTVTLLTLSACATSISSRIDVAENFDPAEFKTYAWVPDQAGHEPTQATITDRANFLTPVNQRRIRVSIEQELARKGYIKAPKETADLALAFTLGARERTEVRNDFRSYGYRYIGFHNRFNRIGLGSSRFGFGSGYRNSPVVRHITEGTLVVDVFDNQEKQPVWHGAATKRLSRNSQSRKVVDEAVETLLNQFPDSAVMAEHMKQMTETRKENQTEAATQNQAISLPSS